MKNREIYIDVTKGLLVLMVIFYHADLYPVHVWGCENLLFEKVNSACYYIMQPYKMAAFFLIHGMFSHFNKPFEDLMKGEALKLIIPMYVLMLGGHNWFCWAMLWADALYWALNRIIQKRSTILIVTILISYISVLLKEYAPEYIFSLLKCNYFIYGTSFIVFLSIGSYLRDLLKSQIHRYIYVGGIVTYLIIIIVYYLNDAHPSEINGISFTVTPVNYPIFMILSITGTLLIFAVSKIIEKMKVSKIFVYVGLNSLVFYLAGFRIMSFISTLVSPYVTNANGNEISSLAVLFVLFIVITALCWVENEVLNTKYLRWVIGKYK